MNAPRMMLAALLLLPYAGQAAEGMWTLDNLPREALKAQYGFEPDEAFITRAKKVSVRLAGGCSGSFISPQGLVLTNHHCIVDCVQALSTAETDYVRDGFLALDRAAERQCPALELNQLESIRDVTAEVAKATERLSGAAFNQARAAAKARLEAECVGQNAETVRCDVVELYQGALLHLYRYLRFTDVRLVFAPEYASGFFGGDPDNFNFPRFSFDAALLRVYRKGQPFASRTHLPVRVSGAEPGELTMVLGHPGSTQRLRTVAQLERERDVDLIERLLYLAELRGVLLQFGRQGEEAARVAARDLMSVENGYKVLRGQLAALTDPVFFQRKRDEWQALRAALIRDERALERLAAAERRIEQAQQRYRLIHRPYQLIERGRGFQGELFSLARDLVRAADEREKPDTERLRGYTEAALPRLAQRIQAPVPISRDYEEARLAWSLTKLREQLGPDDPFVQLVLGQSSPEAVAERVVRGTRLNDPQLRQRLWEGGAAAIAASSDPMIQLARAIDAPAREWRKRYEDEVEAVEKRAAETLAALRFQAFGTTVAPDATFSLRLSYGEVRGWQEGERRIEPFTTFAGLYARATGADPFRLAPRWVKARERLDLDTRFNFVSTHDIVGGNSGSPVINREGELVGLAFDGNLPSIGGTYGYDERLNRAVSVHSAALVASLRAVYGAEALLSEMTLRE